MTFIKNILFVVWFFAPAGLANLAAFASGKIPGIKKIKYPMDFYLKFRGKRIMGNHKTIRGLISAVLFGILCCYLEMLFFNLLPFIHWFVTIDYNRINPLYLGGLLGLGDATGDAVKSFFKRQQGLVPGRSWFPFDQIDYILGGIFLSSLYIRLAIYDYVFLFIVWFLLHPLTTFIGYLFKLRHKPL